MLSRPYTELAAAEHLKKRGASPEETKAIIKEFHGMGLLDDAVYAQLFLEGHESWGLEKICFELRQRGVSEENLSHALENYSGDEAANALRLVTNWKEQGVPAHRITARLLRRGFSMRTVRKTMSGDETDEVEW
ncbi:MAG: regulatory protein RecX [Fretibacterium sp.]|nr:regulatory protein RecX [Fretibacterium sp.]